MRSLLLPFLIASLPAVAQPGGFARTGEGPTETHLATARSLATRFDRPPAYALFRQYRFSQAHPEASDGFFLTLEPDLQALTERYTDSLALAYAARLDEPRLLRALDLVGSPLGLRYLHFLRDGLWARVRDGWFWEAARHYRGAGLSAEGRTPADPQDAAWTAFGRRFVDAPDLARMRARLGDDTLTDWGALRERAADSMARRVAGVARDFLGPTERDSLTAAFARAWGAVLDPSARDAGLARLDADYTRRIDRRILQRWRQYAYRNYRYPVTGESRTFREQPLRVAFQGEVPDGRTLDWRHDGIAWIVEAPKARDRDAAVLERWTQDLRFPPDGTHVVYFVRKPVPPPVPGEPHPDGSARAIGAEALEAHLRTLPPKARRAVLAALHVRDGQRTWVARPFGR